MWDSFCCFRCVVGVNRYLMPLGHSWYLWVLDNVHACMMFGVNIVDLL